jgi:NHLM bacteriocin system ABC transporter ATP-binding protein
MLNQINFVAPQAQKYLFKGNETILLNDPQTFWLVKSGALALFAITVKDDIPEGRRRYLFTVSSNQAVFSTTANTERQLIAVSMEETELVKVSAEDFSRLIANGDSSMVNLLEDWIHQLGSALSDITTPTIPVKLEGINYFSLDSEEIFQPCQGAVSWVRIQQGYATWMGFEQLPLSGASVIMPLSSDMWLQAANRLELSTFNTLEIRDIESILQGLTQLVTYFLDCIDLLDASEFSVELFRFQEKERLNSQVVDETLLKLASILQQKKTIELTHSVSSDDPNQALLTAVGAVARASGITIYPPAKSESRRAQDPLEAIARTSRIRMRKIALTDKWWKKDSVGILAYTIKDDRPVALLPTNGNYEIFDPVEGTRTSINARNAPKLAPSGWIFYASLPNKRLKFPDLLGFALFGHYKELIIIILTGVAVAILGMLTPGATAILIDSAIPDANQLLLLEIGLGLLAAAFGETLFQLAQAFAIMRLDAFAQSSTQAAIWDRLLNLKTSFFRSYSIGDLNSRVSSITQIHQKLSSTVLKSIFSSFFSLLNLGLLFYYSPLLAVLACLVAVVNIAVTIVSGIISVRKIRPLVELQGEIFGLMVQLMNGVAKLRVSGAEGRAFAHWGQQYHQQIKLLLNIQVIEDTVTIINKILPPLTNAAVFAIAVSLLQKSQTGGFSIGTFLAFNTAFGSFVSGATTLSSTVVDVLEVVPLWKRAEPILLAEPEVNNAKTDPGKLSGKLRIDHIVFRYRNDGALTLDNVSIHAEPGEFIAIVGPSGSGKSTLFRLLLGFETSKAGAVYYDGQDLAGLDVYAVRRQLGVVMQNSRMMSGSIFDNIASNALISMEEAWEAAEMAGLAEDIQAMPMGMHTVISEGATNLSGGQRQRLLIAKALALKPRILLFDEATSALDNKTQAIVSQSLERLQVTRIAIAHRLSTIRNAHRIYVLQDGRVVQQGSFEQLAQESGLFAQLMARQKL